MTQYTSNQFPAVKVRRPRSRKGVTQVKSIHSLVYIVNDKVREKIITGTWILCDKTRKEKKASGQYKDGYLDILPA